MASLYILALIVKVKDAPSASIAVASLMVVDCDKGFKSNESLLNAQPF